MNDGRLDVTLSDSVDEFPRRVDLGDLVTRLDVPEEIDFGGLPMLLDLLRHRPVQRSHTIGTATPGARIFHVAPTFMPVRVALVELYYYST